MGFPLLLEVLADIPDSCLERGQLYKLPYVPLLCIFVIVTGCNSEHGMVAFIDAHRHRLNPAVSLRLAPHRQSACTGGLRTPPTTAETSPWAELQG